MSRPLAIDLFCGLGGWTEGLLAEGYDVIGFDIERHEYGAYRYPAQLVVQDVLTLHGSQFRDAALIVASPPCQAYSYRAMPWKRAKALPPPDNALFDACFRIQREASEAAGRHIPLVVENVRGAQPWVGRARWNFGSFYLWGDVPALMPMISPRAILKPQSTERRHGTGSWFAIDMKSARAGITKPADITGTKSRVPATGKRWDERVAETDEHAAFHYKLPGFRFDGSGRSFQSASVEGTKCGGDWFNAEQPSISPLSSKSPARKQASAMIAKIPLPLSRHIARVYAP